MSAGDRMCQHGLYQCTICRPSHGAWVPMTSPLTTNDRDWHQHHPTVTRCHLCEYEDEIERLRAEVERLRAQVYAVGEAFRYWQYTTDQFPSEELIEACRDCMESMPPHLRGEDVTTTPTPEQPTQSPEPTSSE